MFAGVCVCQYKTEQMLRNGEVEMQSRDEELRFLRMQMADDQRSVGVMKRSLPNKRTLEEEVVTLQIQVLFA